MTIKIRAGWDENSIVAVEVARLAEQIGVEGIAVHPRTRAQGYSGPRRLERDPRREASCAHARDRQRRHQFARRRRCACSRETGCDAVMIGRAASNNPWIFPQIAQYAATGPYNEPSEWDRYQLLSMYFRNLVDTEWPDAIGRMKQFTSYFTHGVRNGGELRRNVHTARTPAEILDRVDGFFAQTAA
jgi:tRNA-dihydrouridine synthase B